VPTEIRDTAEFRGVCPDSAVVMSCALGGVGRASGTR
jgi:hypothetical protein